MFSVDNVDIAYDSFLNVTEKLIDKYIPLEKISKQKLKEQQKRKPWVNNVLVKRINHKNKLHKKAKCEHEFKSKRKT